MTADDPAEDEAPMRLVSYAAASAHRQVRPGLLREGELVDLGDSFDSVIDVVTARNGIPKPIADLPGALSSNADLRTCLRAPLPPAGRALLAVGWNYAAHFAEGDAARSGALDAPPEHPSFFVKAATSIAAPYASIVYDPKLSNQLDYEAEVAVVIGAGGRNIPAERALEHVFGYMLANDFTVRDVQRRHGGQWFKGKSLDASCPVGPAVVTADEVGDWRKIEFICELNGIVHQRACAGDMAFAVPEIISRLSEGMTLQPGDVVLTGTPPGVGYARTPPRFLVPGDIVIVRSPQLGELRNAIVAGDMHSYIRSPASTRTAPNEASLQRAASATGDTIGN